MRFALQARAFNMDVACAATRKQVCSAKREDGSAAGGAQFQHGVGGGGLLSQYSHI